jgi:type I restriction enzyme M protein
LDEQVLAKYAKLSEAEIKTLVVEGKWFGSIWSAIEGEMQRVTQQLAGRVKDLEERYARPLPALGTEVEALGAQVADHLRKMGFVVGADSSR